jgi:hypothetical protein
VLEIKNSAVLKKWLLAGDTFTGLIVFFFFDRKSIRPATKTNYFFKVWT